MCVAFLYFFSEMGCLTTFVRTRTLRRSESRVRILCPKPTFVAEMSSGRSLCGLLAPPVVHFTKHKIITEGLLAIVGKCELLAG